jgi:RHS repeat-associated protein
MSLAYDALGRVTETNSSVGGLTTNIYDGNGYHVGSVDGEGRATVFERDLRGDVVSSTDGVGGTSVIERGTLGQVTKVTDPGGGETRFEYDEFGQVVRRTNPLGGEHRFSYDALGRLVTETDPAGRTRTDTYDALGRLVQRQTVDDLATFDYDPAGNLVRVEDGDSAVEFGYDAVNRKVSERTLDKGQRPAVTVTRQLDAAGRRVGLTDSEGGAITYSYDDGERLSAVGIPGGGTVQIGRDAAGRPAEVTFPNGVNTTYSYDSARLARVTHRQDDGAVIGDLAYTYDASGQVASVAEPTATKAFTYDGARQVTAAGTAAAPEAYAYSPEGGRTSSHRSRQYRYNAMGQLLEDEAFTYTYDANGNRTSRSQKSGGATTTYSYDASNQLVAVTLPDGAVTSYRYDGLGRRTEKSQGASVRRFVYDGVDLVLEFDALNALQARSVPGDEPDRPFASQGGGATSFLHADLLGSVRWGTGAAGDVLWSADYDAYGNYQQDPSPAAAPIGFTGREWDSESGFWFYRSRHYDPSTGAFLSPDRIGFLSGDFNLYRYVRNDPVNNTDPTGAEPVTIGLAIGGAIWLGSKAYKWWKGREAKEATRASAQASAARVRQALETNDVEFLKQFSEEQIRQILDAERTAKGACIVNGAELARTLPGTTFTGTPPIGGVDVVGGIAQDLVFDSPAAKPPP